MARQHKVAQAGQLRSGDFMRVDGGDIFAEA